MPHKITLPRRRPDDLTEEEETVSSDKRIDTPTDPADSIHIDR